MCSSSSSIVYSLLNVWLVMMAIGGKRSK
jgi:hypothetical protein